MWYKILIENEYADFLMKFDVDKEVSDEEKKLLEENFKKFGDIVFGVTMSWAFPEFRGQPDKIESFTSSMTEEMKLGYHYCNSYIHLSSAKHLGEIQNKSREIFERLQCKRTPDLMNAEQCAVWLMYPFWSRMGGSYEDDFLESGELKEYLCALKHKCDEQ